MQAALTNPVSVKLSEHSEPYGFVVLRILGADGSDISVHFSDTEFDLLADLGEKVFHARSLLRAQRDAKNLAELTVTEPADDEAIDRKVEAQLDAVAAES
jgi:hypothetical protein